MHHYILGFFFAFLVCENSWGFTPTVPGQLTSTAVSSGQIKLSWTASRVKKSTIQSYHLYRNSQKIATVPGSQLSYQDSGLAAATSYRYQVAALAANGSVSALSLAVVATTLSPENTEAVVTPTPATPSFNNVAWIEVLNATAQGGTLINTFLQWTTGFGRSQQQLSAGAGSAEFTVQAQNSIVAAGLNTGASALNRADIDFAIQLNGGTSAEIWEAGVYKSETSYSVGDKFSVTVDAYGAVRYRKNGSIFYTSTGLARYPLYLSAILSTPSAQVLNALFSVDTIVPIAEPTPTPVTSVPAIPYISNWRQRMIDGGKQFCVKSVIDSAFSGKVVNTEANVWYYDGGKVFQQIAAYTGDASYYTCADYVKSAYRGHVLAITEGATGPVRELMGNRVFPHGLAKDYLRTGDPLSKEAVRRLAKNSAWAAAGGAIDASRETAYMIQTYLAAERTGEPRNPLLGTSVEYALTNINQWFVSYSSATYIQPFFVGLTMAALIEYWEVTGDPRVPPAIETALKGLERFWLAGSQTFVYSTLDATPTHDLNLLIAPAYAWMWQRTGSAFYLERGDQVFSGGVTGASYWSGKQYSQSYRWSFDYVKWRSSAPGSIMPLKGFAY